MSLLSRDVGAPGQGIRRKAKDIVYGLCGLWMALNMRNAKNIWDNVIKTRDDCWTWTGVLTKGRGRWRNEYAHRVIFKLLCGLIPEDMLVCHHCDNPECVSPDHLFLGTQKDNMQDAKRKGRIGTEEQNAENSKKNMGRIVSLETRRLLSNASKGKRPSGASLEASRLAHLGKEHTAESKIKMSKAHTGKFPSTETKQKLSMVRHEWWVSHPGYGRKLSEETKAKISASKKGRVLRNGKFIYPEQ